ncbi:hypothetical protein [Chlamydia sp. 17-3921]|uniref:hypothetical protein n=1 Tax=Chlamydia sp. 17-3921 TaxID=2675798 RepID=UPI00191972EA|nr:hypothetical protein [Chlamydia sp. 17-3921]
MRFLYFLLAICFFHGYEIAFAVPHYVSEEESFFVHHLNFSGDFPDMETMEIQAQRKKQVKFDASGNFPKLESVFYRGSFGSLKANFSGCYPNLSSVNFSCTACKMDLDFRGQWFQNNSIVISNEEQPISLILPQDVGIIVHTKTTFKGKVFINGDFVKQGHGIWNKTYHNSLVGISPITLVFHVRSSGGTISLS